MSQIKSTKERAKGKIGRMSQTPEQFRQWVEVERTSSVADNPTGLKRKVRPLMLRECQELPTFPRFLRPIQAVDVATGTGWAARRMASHGVSVVGIDLGADLIMAARAYAADARLPIEFRVGDAEALPFDDQSFDAVISTFGVMFVSKPEVAIAELGAHPQVEFGGLHDRKR